MKNKGKILGITLGALAALSIGTVGFASWIVAYSTPGTSSDITVKVANVTEKTIAISDIVVTDAKIVLDDVTTDTSGNIVYNNTDALGGEDLSFSFTWKVTCATGSISSASVGAYITYGSSSKLGEFVTNNYLIQPVSTNSASTTTLLDTGLTANAYSKQHDENIVTTVTNSGNEYSCSTTVTFGWGSAFSYSNPGLFDDTLEHTTTALEALKAMQSADTSLTVTLVPTIA
ncbi:MAG: hypothetical protein MJ241_01810 [Bacilli bacterium]|nr:hypothetical protein [Bacilli bacterium]